jgi:hypothetical protein
MYRVSYYMTGSNMASFRSFETLREATEFAIKQPNESIIEIKRYDNQASNPKNYPNTSR